MGNERLLNLIPPILFTIIGIVFTTYALMCPQTGGMIAVVVIDGSAVIVWIIYLAIFVSRKSL